jgi:hypothetical protein
MSKSIVQTSLLVLLLLLATACGQSQAEPVAEESVAATATAEQPTEPPVTPTSTATPEPTTTPTPTATPTPPADSPEGVQEALTTALAQSLEAQVFRMDLDLAVTGLPPEAMMMLGNISLDPNQPTSLLNVMGEFNNNNTRVAVTGLLTMFLEVEPDTGLEFIQYNGQSYIRGPVAFLGAPEDRWYRGEQSLGGMSSVPVTPDAFREELDMAELEMFIEVFDFVLTGNESLDGQECDVYTMDREATLRAIEELNSMSGSDMSGSGQDFNPNDIESAEVKSWICNDGYLHKLELFIEAYSPDMPEQLIGVNFMAHMYDFGGDINIVEPADAIALEQPDLGASPFFGGGNFLEDVGEPEIAPGMLAATVFNGGNIRSAPSLQGAVLGQLQAGETVRLQEQTADGTWYRVEAPAADGWVSATLLTVDPAVAARVPVTGQAAPALPVVPEEPEAAVPPVEPADPTGLTATVFNGGNVRAFPNLQGKVLDQINAAETVQLVAKTSDGSWYKIINPRNQTGWVSVTLLTIDPAVAAQLPVATR